MFAYSYGTNTKDRTACKRAGNASHLQYVLVISVKLFSSNKLCSDLKNLPTSNVPLTLFSLLTLFNFVENLCCFGFFLNWEGLSGYN